MKRAASSLVGVAIALWLGSGCATTRGTLDIRVPPASGTAGTTTVRLGEISDARVFEIDPRKPSTPSLKEDEISDPSITSRAIARKRNTYGMALGDILLPEGRTVQQLVAEVVARGLTHAGYRVVSKTDPGFDQASAVDVEIERFWAWMTPGFWTLDLDFDSKIRLTGPLPPFDPGIEATGKSQTSKMAAGSEAWQHTIQLGLEALADSVRNQLAPHAAGTAGRTPGPDAIGELVVRPPDVPHSRRGFDN